MKWHGDCKDGWVPTYYRQDVDDTHDEGNSSDEEEGFEFVLEGSESITSLGELMVPICRGSSRSINLCYLFYVYNCVK